MDHRSLNSTIESLHKRAIATKVHQFERARLQVSKLKTDLAFLKRCSDSSVIPVFAHINHHIHTPQNHQVFLRASLALLRAEIIKVRRSLNRISLNLLGLHLTLASLIPDPLWARIDTFSALKTLRLEGIEKV